MGSASRRCGTRSGYPPRQLRPLRAVRGERGGGDGGEGGALRDAAPRAHLIQAVHLLGGIYDLPATRAVGVHGRPAPPAATAASASGPPPARRAPKYGGGGEGGGAAGARGAGRRRAPTHAHRPAALTRAPALLCTRAVPSPSVRANRCGGRCSLHPPPPPPPSRTRTPRGCAAPLHDPPRGHAHALGSMSRSTCRPPTPPPGPAQERGAGRAAAAGGIAQW